MSLTNREAIPFIYLVGPFTLGASQSTNQTLVMQADSHFELCAIVATGGNASTTENSLFYPNSFSVSIRDQTTGRDLTSGRVPQRILCGNAFQGMLQRRPILFLPQSNLLFDFLDLSGANNTITLALHGFKLFGGM
jgi:hypothetical protein